MADPAILDQADVVASAATVAVARRFAVAQARVVGSKTGRADVLAIDLLFLAHESVLVFEEAHNLIAAVAAGADIRSLSEPPQWLARLRAARTSRARRRRRLIILLPVAFALAALMVLVEALDPIPMGVRGMTLSWSLD